MLKFESKTIPKCFRWGRFRNDIIVKLIGGYDKLLELGFREKITSMAL